MTSPLSRRRLPRRLLPALLALCLPLALVAPAAGAGGPGDGGAMPPLPEPVGVAPPAADDVPAPPPVRPGHVRRVPGPPTAGEAGAVTEHPQTRPGPTARRTAPALSPTGAVLPARPVELRALVLAVDGDDLGLAPWRATLDRVGAAYDVVHAGATPLTRDLLVAADGTGRYNAVLLTSGALLQPVDGGWASALDAAEWNTLWDYERDFAVRQATLFGSYGSWPEETCLVGSSEGGVDEAGITASLTARGAQVFDDLNPQAAIPVQLSYVYRNRVAPGCAAEPVLVSGEDVLGVTRTTPDGREQVQLSFSSHEHLLQSHLLVHGMFRWASRGMYLGEQRHYLKLDVDDYFNASDLMRADLTLDPDGFRMTGDDALNMAAQQAALRAAHPLAAQFRLTLAYNGEGVATATPASCAGGGQDALVAATRCVMGQLEWINHTYTHPKMNFTDLTTSTTEITRNRRAARELGLSVPRDVLKTGEYSGLGVYHPDVTNDIDPPTDHGLAASNPALIQAARATGTTYLHGNMSFASHRPSCFNCDVAHPLDPAVRVVPDWPTNIAYFSSTPEQETAFYNWFYGPEGKFPYWPQDQTYAQVLEHESTGALHRIATGSIYTNTMHIPNLHDYGGGRTLAFDWLEAVVGRYEALYAVPLLSPTWPALARATTVRSQHFAVKDQVRAVWDPAARVVRLLSPVAGKVLATGLRGTSRTTYGTSVISTLTLTAGQPLAVTAQPRP